MPFASVELAARVERAEAGLIASAAAAVRRRRPEVDPLLRALPGCDGVAQLWGSATLPDHRRRGVQTALLAWRLAEAAREGADLAVMTTQPGSPSQRNAQRQGFELLYSRAVLVRGA